MIDEQLAQEVILVTDQVSALMERERCRLSEAGLDVDEHATVVINGIINALCEHLADEWSHNQGDAIRDAEWKHAQQTIGPAVATATFAARHRYLQRKAEKN